MRGRRNVCLPCGKPRLVCVTTVTERLRQPFWAVVKCRCRHAHLEAMDDSAVPSYLTVSPIGYHVVDILPFFRSAYKAPVSEDPKKRGWASADAARHLDGMFPHTAAGIAEANILVYNKSRDTDRICPSCRRWYHVGEKVGPRLPFNEFLVRQDTLQVDEDCKLEQNLSGICSRECMRSMTHGNDTVFGKGIEDISAEDFSALDPRPSGWTLRKATPQEEEATGIKIFWVNRG